MLNNDEKKIIKAIPEGADHPRSMKELAGRLFLGH